MFLICYKEIELRVLLYLDTKLIETFDRGITCEEVLRTWAESDYLQSLQADNDAGYGDELSNHLCHFLCCAYRILWYVAFQVSHTEVIRAVEHAAVCVSTTVDHIAITLCCCHEHAWAVEVLRDKCLWCLRAEITEEYNEGVASSLFHLCHCLEHVFFVLNCCLAIEQFSLVCLYNVLATLCGERDRETVTADGNDAELDLRNVSTFHN